MLLLQKQNKACPVGVPRAYISSVQKRNHHHCDSFLMEGSSSNHPPPPLVASGFTQATGGEPDLSGVCKSESDKVTLRNVIYTLWAVNNTEPGGGSAASASCYLVSEAELLIQKTSLFFFILSWLCMSTQSED